MAKVLASFEAKYGSFIEVGVIDINSEPEIAEQFNVQYVPHILFLNADGDVFEERVGFTSEKDVVKIFRDAGYIE